MKEHESAEYYDKHLDDDDLVGEPEGQRGRKPERRRLNAMVSVRLTPMEEDRIRAEALRRGVSVSAFMRSIALREATPPAQMVPLTKTSSSASAQMEARIADNIGMTRRGESELPTAI